jgi:hypothetical protein
LSLGCWSAWNRTQAAVLRRRMKLRERVEPHERCCYAAQNETDRARRARD